MRHLVLTIVAIGLAGVAAVAATTAMLNTPLRIGPAAGTTAAPAQPGQPPAEGSAKPATQEIPDAPAPKGAEPQASPPAATGPAGATPPAGETPEDPDKDPYEGIAPEDLPPDLQYDADASVSFPTNT